MSQEISEGVGNGPFKCDTCGRAARVEASRNGEVICRDCRCSYCKIPLSFRICRCGVAHGKPSEIPHLCERCYVLKQAAGLPLTAIIEVAAPAPSKRSVEEGVLVEEDAFDMTELDDELAWEDGLVLPDLPAPQIRLSTTASL